jgi:hypothetical protein
VPSEQTMQRCPPPGVGGVDHDGAAVSGRARGSGRVPVIEVAERFGVSRQAVQRQRKQNAQGDRVAPEGGPPRPSLSVLGRVS